MDLEDWSEIPDGKLGEFDYGVKHSDDASIAVGYTHADPGFVVWATEGKLHEGGPEARLGFHIDKQGAKDHVHDYARDHGGVMTARQAVRGTGDAAKGVANPDGMEVSLPWSAFGGGRSVKRAVENAFSSPEELAEASDAHLRSFEGVGPKTVEDLRRWLAEEGYADEDPTTPDPDSVADLDLDVEPSGLDLDDSATEITGVGDSSNLADETVGDFWEMGCPFHEVAPAWQDEALRDILGASFFINTQTDHLIRVFAGFTAAYAYDDTGEQLGNYAEAMFGQFAWEDVTWAWADHGLSTDFGDAAAADEVIEHQAAVATGGELPFEKLDFDPEEDHGLSGLHGTRSVDTYAAKNGTVWFEYRADIDAEENEVYVPKATVELYSLLFNADFSDSTVAGEHLYLVADTGTSAESKQRTLGSDHNDNSYIAVFDHPDADAYGIAEGQITITPSDFDLTEPNEYQAWAEQVASQVKERRDAFEQEMERGPNNLRQLHGVAPDNQLDDAAGVSTLTEDDTHPDDRTYPDREEVWQEQMEGIYDPSREFDANIEAAESSGVLASDGGTYDPSDEFENTDRKPLSVGTIVEHPQYGRGEVVKVGPGGWWVDFTGDGTGQRVDHEDLEASDADTIEDDMNVQQPDDSDDLKVWEQDVPEYAPREVGEFTLDTEYSAPDSLKWYAYQGSAPDQISKTYKATGRWHKLRVSDSGDDRGWMVSVTYVNRREGVKSGPKVVLVGATREAALAFASAYMSEFENGDFEGGDLMDSRDPWQAGRDAAEGIMGDLDTTGISKLYPTNWTTGEKGEPVPSQVAGRNGGVYDPTGGYDSPDEDDLSDALAAKGVNNITAHNLGEQYDTVNELREAAEAADSITDLHGVGDGSAEQVREALGMVDQSGDDDQAQTVALDRETGESHDLDHPGDLNGWTYQENPVPSRGTLVWIDREDESHYVFVEKTGSDTWLAGRRGGTDGRVNRSASSESAAISEAEVLMQSPPENSRDQDTATDGGTQAASGSQSDANQSDDDSLPWQARKVLSGAWGNYKRMLKEGKEAREEVAEYRALRDDGMDAAAAINEVRRAHGQEPIDFDGVDDIEGVEEVGGPLLPEDTGSGFEWDSSGTYDPTEEFE